MGDKRSGRPVKGRTQLKDQFLLIRVSRDQKDRIQRAVQLDGGDMAAWARLILLRAAEERIGK